MKRMNFTVLAALSFILMACPGPFHPISHPEYNLFISYKNSKGEDLLNPSTVGAFNRDSVFVFQPGNNLNIGGIGELKTANGLLPPGYYLNIIQSYGNGIIDVISLRNKLIDTLTTTRGSNYMVTSCKYNSTDIKPPGGMTSFPLPFHVTIVK